jgi:hypothetical protein
MSKKCVVCGSEFPSFTKLYAHQGLCENSNRATDEELTGIVPSTTLSLEIILSNLCVDSPTLPLLLHASIFDLARLGASCRHLHKVAQREMNQNFWETASRRLHPVLKILSGGDWKRAVTQEIKFCGIPSAKLERCMARGDNSGLSWFVGTWTYSERKTEHYVKRCVQDYTIELRENSEATYSKHYFYGQTMRGNSYDISGQGTWVLRDHDVSMTLIYERRDDNSFGITARGIADLRIPLAKFHHAVDQFRRQPDWEWEDLYV